MSKELSRAEDPRIVAALLELKDRIRLHYPSVSFDVSCEDDPEGVYLTAIVDADDPDAVMDTIVDRLLEIDENLPVYVIPVRTPERSAVLLAQSQYHRGGQRHVQPLARG